MYNEGPVVFADIEREVNHQQVDLELGGEESSSLDKVKCMLDPEDGERIISLIQVDEEESIYRIVSCRKFKRLENTYIEHFQNYFWVENYLKDYEAYLDYLYINGVEEVDELAVSLEDFEAVLKAITYYYETFMSRSKNYSEFVKLTNKNNSNLIFFSSDYFRTTFSSTYLSKVRGSLKELLGESKNQPGITEIAKMLKKEPRPKMKVNNHD